MNATGSDSAHAQLRDAVHRWSEALEALRLTLSEDRPVPGDSALADGLADATDDVVGWLKETEAGLAGSEGTPEAARLIARAIRRQGDTLFSRETHAQLDRLARVGGPRWLAWVRAVRGASDPLWSLAEEVVRRLSVVAGPTRDPFSHTTYRQTHFCNTDTPTTSAP